MLYVAYLNGHTYIIYSKYPIFFSLFQDHEVTLEYAGNVLMPDSVECYDGNVFVQPVTNPKSKEDNSNVELD